MASKDIKSYTLDRPTQNRIKEIQETFALSSASEAIALCVNYLPDPAEMQHFNDFVEYTFSMFAKVRQMHVRRLGVMLKIAEGVGGLGLPPEKLKPLFDLFGEYGTDEEMQLDVFLEKGAMDFSKLKDMHAGVKIGANLSASDAEYLERVRDFMEREQRKIREILAQREHVHTMISALLAERRDPGAAEKMKTLSAALELKELEKLASEAGQFVMTN